MKIALNLLRKQGRLYFIIVSFSTSLYVSEVNIIPGYRIDNTSSIKHLVNSEN